MSSVDGVKPIRVAIVTPVFNRRELTLQCLRSLSRIDRTGLDVRIIVVDDGSTDGTSQAVAENFPDVTLVSGTGDLWYTAGTNLGIHKALKHDPDYVLCINDDSIFDENCVRRMIDCAERHPRSVIGGLLLLWDQPHRVFQVAPVWKTWKGGWQHWYEQTVWTVPASAWEVDLIVGNCVLFPAEVFSKVGFLKPQVSAQYGDAEFTIRLRKNGWRLLIEPRARVFCQPNEQHVSITKKPLRKQFELLFRKRSSVNNLRQQINIALHTAPNKLSGFLAFFAFYGHLFKRKLRLDSSSNGSKSEGKLADAFAAYVVKE